jgi:hypothetical protein
MRIDKFQPSDLLELPPQDAQTCVSLLNLDPNYARTLALHDSWTGRVGDRVVGCAGIIPVWQGRYQVWAVLASDIGASGMVVATRIVRRCLSLYPGARIEATVVSDFEPGHRWMDILGFVRETPEPMRRYLPDGRDAVLYSRVK